MANVFDIKDSRGKTVYCDEECWTKHILGNHPHMQEWMRRVTLTIEKPDFISEDVDRRNRHNYYRLVKNRQKFIKVVVEFADEDVGNVITAFAANNLKPKEPIIWEPERTK